LFNCTCQSEWPEVGKLLKPKFRWACHARGLQDFRNNMGQIFFVKAPGTPPPPSDLLNKICFFHVPAEKFSAGSVVVPQVPKIGRNVKVQQFKKQK
jgi:hypothetical protein